MVRERDNNNAAGLCLSGGTEKKNPAVGAPGQSLLLSEFTVQYAAWLSVIFLRSMSRVVVVIQPTFLLLLLVLFFFFWSRGRI